MNMRNWKRQQAPEDTTRDKRYDKLRELLLDIVKQAVVAEAAAMKVGPDTIVETLTAVGTPLWRVRELADEADRQLELCGEEP